MLLGPPPILMTYSSKDRYFYLKKLENKILPILVIFDYLWGIRFLWHGRFWKGANGKNYSSRTLETKCKDQNFDITPQSFVMVMGVISSHPPTSDNPAQHPRWKGAVVSSTVRSLKTKLPYFLLPYYHITVLPCYYRCYNCEVFIFSDFEHFENEPMAKATPPGH